MCVASVYFLPLLAMTGINTAQNQNFQWIVTLQETGTDFVPANPIEPLATYSNVPTLTSYYNQCNLNARCGTFFNDIN
jgi:hypothetical protein